MFSPMKPLWAKNCFKAALLAVMFAGWNAAAQMPGGGMNAVLTQLFGDIQGFTAKVDVRVIDKSNQEMFSMPMNFAFLDKKLRIQMDLTQMKNRQMPAGMTDALKKMGMAEVISIVRPDKNLTYTLYPAQNAVLTSPMQDEAVTVKSKKAQGKETLDGHPCVKNLVVTVDSKGRTTEATTWNATDLKDFPLQVQSKEEDNTSVLRFTQVQLTKPDAQQFAPPESYAKYSDPQALQQAVMKKMAEGADKK